jgi:diguanylate cyclase (GGDEF)-like protein
VYTEISISTGVMIFLVVLVAIWMASYLNKRITRLINGINHFEQGELGFHLPLQSNDEMGQLTTSFNKMAGKIESSFRAMRTSAEELTLKNADNQRLMSEMELEISQRLSAEQTLKHLAYFDSLTELPNRSQLNKKLQEVLGQTKAEKESLALLFIDLDGFKDVNDTLGHTIGDKLLLKVANRLRNQSRDEDFIARLGGDEFTIILRNVATPSVAGKIAQKIIDTLSMKFNVSDHDIYIGASIGICTFSNHDMNIDNVMKNADTAMYQAKEEGRGCYRFCTPELNKKIEDRMQMAHDLRNALENQEFILNYQPKIDGFTSEVIGLEALIRWQHPENGLVPPDEFIPMAEETGMIVKIGEWVLREVCQQLNKWELQGFQLVPIAVNVSARQFSQSDLVEVVSFIVDESGIDPKLLEIEVTETLVMQNPDQTIDILQTLTEKGINSSIDDFGTGYSSLAYLKRFPVSTLKIDREFISDLESGSNSVELVLAMISMAHSMGLKVVAEGVENKEEQEILRKMDCDFLQGYLFSRPLPADELGAWLSKPT